MKKNILACFLIVFSLVQVFAQKKVNDYKYVLIPRQYEFQRTQDSYQVNSLTRFLFNKAGFTALFMDESYPEDLATNSCLALKAMLLDNSGMFRTKMKFSLVDCYNKEVFATSEGSSKEKDYKKAYHGVIRSVFGEIDALNYKYSGSSENINKSKEVVKTTEQKISPKVETVKIEDKSEKKEIEVKKIKEPVKEKKPAIEKVKKSKNPKVKRVKSPVKNILGKYMMDNWGICLISKTGNQYSLVGGDENFEFATIYKTSKPNIYIIKWVAYKQPQLLVLDKDGHLIVDAENGVKVYKRVD